MSSGPADGPPGDLTALAATVAALTGGRVTVQDDAGRTLVGPALTPAPDVRRRLRTGEEIVTTDDLHAIGVAEGGRPLGSIWVRTRPGADVAETLLGAARLAVPRFVDLYHRGDPAARAATREDLAHSLLTGRLNPASIAAHLGVDPDAAASVVAVDLRDPPNRPGREVRRAEAAEIVSVHAAALRGDALVTHACGQIYAMLPEKNTDPERTLSAWADRLVTALRAYTRTPVQAAVGGLAPDLSAIPEVKLRAHQILKIIAPDPARTVATHTSVRAGVVLLDVLDLLAQRPDVRHPALDDLAVHDREHGTELARSLRLYLDAFGDVGKAARALHVHPNTLRHRVRRAAELTGLDLDDPDERLVAMLQLRLLNTDPTGPAFPVPAPHRPSRRSIRT
ncbi:PucR family transcriptional regulator [Actinomadura algeriensis]|uniref:Sugar diacid utilization regulator n=1 Tax=Actinomadura algeriensis TaxID=1679523 RepID=A0ABR9JR01_9ACTN|nr:helix-turn-helix domain-containing protein [Actinomadura algeriensis]MBE1532986.1 sugar diacid utilization regulator [Actinomadura algeriensis]